MNTAAITNLTLHRPASVYYNNLCSHIVVLVMESLKY